MTGIVKRLEFIAQILSSDQIALTDETNALSYSELIHRVKDESQWLSGLNVKVVALHGQNSIDWVILDLACQEAGIVCVPLPTFFSVDQIEHCLLQAGVDLILSDQKNFDTCIDQGFNLSSLEGRSSFHAWRILNANHGEFPSETQKITFTSGSTGSPKGVCLSAKHQWQVAQSLADVIEIRNPRHLCLLPLSTLLENIAGVYNPLLCGGCVVLVNDAERGLSGSSGLAMDMLLACIERVQPETMILIPQLLTVLVAACEQGWRPPTFLKFVAVGGAKVSPDLISIAHQYGIPVYQGYGLSECGSVVALNTPKEQNVDSVGRVLSHCTVSIENSEIIVTEPCHLGYLGEPESWNPTAVHTGDIGTLEDGWLMIDGRQKNILITSFGRNVSPEWVESELMSTPLLSHCMVVGDGKPYLGALVSAPSTITNTDIREWVERVNERLPDYARVLVWQRITESSLNKYATPNSRLQRAHAEKTFKHQIEKFYSADSTLAESY